MRICLQAGGRPLRQSGHDIIPPSFSAWELCARSYAQQSAMWKQSLDRRCVAKCKRVVARSNTARKESRQRWRRDMAWRDILEHTFPSRCHNVRTLQSVLSRQLKVRTRRRREIYTLGLCPFSASLASCPTIVEADNKKGARERRGSFVRTSIICEMRTKLDRRNFISFLPGRPLSS